MMWIIIVPEIWYSINLCKQIEYDKPKENFKTV